MALNTLGSTSYGSIGASGSATGIYSVISATNSEEYGATAKAKDASGDIKAAYLYKAIGTVTVNGYASAYEAPALGGTATANGQTGTIMSSNFQASNQDFAKATVTAKFLPGSL